MLLLPMGANAVGSITSIGAFTAAFANFILVPFVNARVNSAVSSNLRVACFLMATGFFLFSLFNGGVESKPCTTPECSSSDTQAVHKDAFYYSLAACTVFLGLGGAILAACCSATLSGWCASLSARFMLTCGQVLFMPIKAGLCLAWIWLSGSCSTQSFDYLIIHFCIPALPPGHWRLLSAELLRLF
jgi:hypothetical protein